MKNKIKVPLGDYIEWYITQKLGETDFNCSDHNWSESVRKALRSITAENYEVEIDWLITEPTDFERVENEQK